MPMPVYGILEM